MMQILYGNDGMNYCVIAKSKDVNESIINEITNRGFLFYDFPKGSYSSSETEPVSLAYTISSFNGIFPEEMLIIAQSKRMGNRNTPSYYTHIQITGLPKKITDLEFCRILNRKFIKDIDVMNYKEQDIDNFVFEPKEENLNPYSFDKEEYLKEPSKEILTKIQIQMILSFLYQGLQYLGNPVIVVLDKEGDEYNNRAKEVIFTIYQYIPYALRDKIGFCTYYSLGISKIDGVRLVIVERNTNCSGYQNVVDLNRNFYEKLEEISSQNIVYTLVLNRERKTVLQLHDFFSYEDMTIEESMKLFSEVYDYFNLQKRELAQKVLDQYADFFYDKYNRKGELINEIRKTLNKKLKNYEEKYKVNFYLQQLERVLYEQKENQWFSASLIKYIYLGEALEIDFKSIIEIILKWFKTNVLEIIYDHDKKDRNKILSDLCKIRERVDKNKILGKGNFKEVCFRLFYYVSMEIKKIK